MQEDIEGLVRRYEQNRTEYVRSDSVYSESDTRADFIDPFFAALGWDVTNKAGLSRRLREVIRETHAAGPESTKRPDYEFKLGPERKFFVEVKRPSVNVKDSAAVAFQARRYGWSANLLVSVVTNFEFLAIYDTTIEPKQEYVAGHSRLRLFHYSEYAAKYDEISGLLSRDAVYSGQFDSTFATPSQRPSETVDVIFLRQLNRWRLALGQEILAFQPDVDAKTLNELA